MDNKVFYGEYSLKHWIELVLKQNITLPSYQRHFVWKLEGVKKLITAFKDKQFVPPITIGAFKIDATNQNLILDGQQRLTSILLAYLGIFPKEKSYPETIVAFANENDDSNEEDESLSKILKWTFKALTQEGRTKADILQKISSKHQDKYDIIDYDIEDVFLENTFLGFSYLVPKTDDDTEQIKYYSTVFRNINILGKPLLEQESRASLYFLNKNLEAFFNPSFSEKIIVKNVGGAAKIDFVRNLSMLSQYKKDNSSNRIARGYKPNMEKYYEKYIYSTVNNEASSLFGQFSLIFPDNQYEPRLRSLQQTIETLDIPTEHDSIIALDLYFMGLIYITLFQNKMIDTERVDELKHRLTDEINIFRNDPSHAKSPNNLGHLRRRIESSITIYETFSVEI